MTRQGCNVHKVGCVSGRKIYATFSCPKERGDIAHLLVMNVDDAGATRAPMILSMMIQHDEARTIPYEDWRVQLLNALFDQRETFGYEMKPGALMAFGEFEGFTGCSFHYASESFALQMTTSFVEVMPIYKEEFEFLQIMPDKAFFDRLIKANALPMTLHRPNVCKDQNWTPLISPENIRMLVTPPLGEQLALVHKDILLSGRDAKLFYRVDDTPSGSSGWIFMITDEPTSNMDSIVDFIHVSLNTVANYLPYVVPYLALSAPVMFKRDGKGVIHQDPTFTQKLKKKVKPS